MNSNQNKFDLYVSQYTTTTKEEAVAGSALFKSQVCNPGRIPISNYTIHKILEMITGGHTINLGLVKNKNLIAFDIDNQGKKKVDYLDLVRLLKSNLINPIAVFTTLSSTEDHPRYRFLIQLNKIVEDKDEYEDLTRTIIDFINDIYPDTADTRCSSAATIFYQYKKKIYGLAKYSTLIQDILKLKKTEDVKDLQTSKDLDTEESKDNKTSQLTVSLAESNKSLFNTLFGSLKAENILKDSENNLKSTDIKIEAGLFSSSEKETGPVKTESSQSTVEENNTVSSLPDEIKIYPGNFISDLLFKLGTLTREEKNKLEIEKGISVHNYLINDIDRKSILDSKKTVDNSRVKYSLWKDQMRHIPAPSVDTIKPVVKPVTTTYRDLKKDIQSLGIEKLFKLEENIYYPDIFREVGKDNKLLRGKFQVSYSTGDHLYYRYDGSELYDCMDIFEVIRRIFGYRTFTEAKDALFAFCNIKYGSSDISLIKKNVSTYANSLNKIYNSMTFQAYFGSKADYAMTMIECVVFHISEAIKDWKYESFGRPQIWISQTALVNYISEELKLTPTTVKSQGYYSTVLRDLIKIGFFERVQPNEFNTYIRKKNSLNSRFGTPISVYRLPYFSVHLLKVFEDRMEADMESRRDMEIQRMKLEAPKKALNFAKEEKFFKEMMEYAVKQIVLNKGRLPVLQVANHMEHLYPNLTKRHLQRKVNEHADALAQELNLEKKVVDGILKSKLSRNKETAPWAGYINRSIVLVKKPGSKSQVKEVY